MTEPEAPDPVGGFIEMYGEDALVVAGTMPMTLGQALKMEQMFCPADSAERLDPIKRLHYLAGMLAAAGSLRPEHEELLSSSEE
jgi:hypothetical protein